MRLYDIIGESPLQDYQPMGNWDRSHGFRHDVDRKLVTHPTNIQKTYKFFEQTSYDFRIYPVNLPGLRQYVETGARYDKATLVPAFKKAGLSDEQLNTIFGPDTEDTITVIYIGNSGDARVMLTPWVMAHRFGHAIQSTTRSYSPQNEYSEWGNADKTFFKSVNEILTNYYGVQLDQYRKKYDIQWEQTAKYCALFNAIGTQRSSREGLIKRPYEFIYECFAQYLKTGTVTLNPLPKRIPYGRKAWGHDTNWLSLRNQETEGVTDNLARILTGMFQLVLDDCVGKVFIM